MGQSQGQLAHKLDHLHFWTLLYNDAVTWYVYFLTHQHVGPATRTELDRWSVARSTSYSRTLQNSK